MIQQGYCSSERPNMVIVPAGTYRVEISEDSLTLITVSEEAEGKDDILTIRQYGLFAVWGTTIENLTVMKMLH